LCCSKPKPPPCATPNEACGSPPKQQSGAAVVARVPPPRASVRQPLSPRVIDHPTNPQRLWVGGGKSRLIALSQSVLQPRTPAPPDALASRMEARRAPELGRQVLLTHARTPVPSENSIRIANIVRGPAMILPTTASFVRSEFSSSTCSSRDACLKPKTVSFVINSSIASWWNVAQTIRHQGHSGRPDRRWSDHSLPSTHSVRVRYA
jgi:hypothetical protein